MQVVTDAEDAVECLGSAFQVSLTIFCTSLPSLRRNVSCPRTVAILAAAVSIDEDVPDAGETQTKAIQDIEKPGTPCAVLVGPSAIAPCQLLRAATKASSNLIEVQALAACMWFGVASAFELGTPCEPSTDRPRRSSRVASWR